MRGLESKGWRNRAACSDRRVQRGASLIEVLVAVLIMGVGLLGIAAMQTTALRNSQSSLERSQAVIQTYSVVDAMRANRASALANDYNQGSMTCAVPTGTPTTLAQRDLIAWFTSLKTTLGRTGDTTSCGQIVCNTVAAGICEITVRWDDSRATDAMAAGGTTTQSSATEQIVTRVRL